MCTPTWSATASSSPRRPPSTASSTASSVGTSGWNYRAWRGAFYPDGLPASRWLEFYADRFDTVEVNATFYRLQNPAAVARWLEQTPPGFTFAVKASHYLTHIKRLTDLEQGLENFYTSIEPLVATKLGVVLWQLPPNFKRDDERLATALDTLPPGRHAVEFRHDSWFAPDVYAVLRERNAAFVNAQHTQRDFPFELTADFTYLRFHWGRRGRRGNYSPTELDAWAARIDDLRRRAIDVFAYFNNDWEAFAPRNARDLIRRL